MSILPQAVRDTLGALARHLLPGSCLLCGADSENTLLCPACSADLPHQATALCPQCGIETSLGERCGTCLKSPPAFTRTIAAFRYEFPVDRLIQALKYNHQLPLANWFGGCLSEQIAADEHDLLLPLPLHPSRLQDRGFNQSVEIARAIHRRLGIPMNVDCLTRIRATPPQAALPLKERAKNVRGAFECTVNLSGKRILLVDDVMTTGSTLRECARVLELHGAAQITLAVVARALRH
jgi:ComF family protein